MDATTPITANITTATAATVNTSADIVTIVIGGILMLAASSFVFRLIFTIMTNLINGRKFHDSLEQQFNKLRLSNMLIALGINKTEYIYRANVNDIQTQMSSCSSCSNTMECDEKLSEKNIGITEIDFCQNEADLIKINQQQKESKSIDA